MVSYSLWCFLGGYWLRYAIINFTLLWFSVLVYSHVSLSFKKCVVQHHDFLDNFLREFALLHTLPLRYTVLPCPLQFIWVNLLLRNSRTLKSQGVCIIDCHWFAGCDTDLTFFELVFIMACCTISLNKVHWYITFFLCVSLVVSDPLPPSVSSVSKQREIKFESD